MKITQRLVVLFLIVSLAFTVFIYLFFLIKQQEGKLYSQADAFQRRQILNAFIDIKKNEIIRLVDENAGDADIIRYTSLRGSRQAINDLNKILVKNNLDLIQICDKSGESIYNVISNEQSDLQYFRLPREVFEDLTYTSRKYFTEPLKNQYIQMGVATIYEPSDTLRTGDIKGFFIIGKLWSTSYLEDFSQTLDYNVRFFREDPSALPINPYLNVNISIPLYGWANKPVGWLRFSSHNPFIQQWQSLGKQIILGILAFTIVFIMLQFALLLSWIRTPLHQISESLRYGNPKMIEPLAQKNNEYGEIANLIRRFFEQNLQLRLEMEERRRTEVMLRQAQKMESIGTLAGGIAHDFNNIITIISGYVALASGKAKSNPDVRSNLDEAMLACFRAKKLIEKILTFSRQTDKNVQPVCMKTLVQETVELLSHTIPSSITISTDLKSSAYVLADPTEMQQVVMNITSNSYHAMRYQGGTITLELTDCKGSEIILADRTLEPNQQYICLTVKDTGSGIPQEILDRIFDPYFSTKPAGEGTGLGLSIVHGIVTGNDGVVNISSVLEQGTVVNVYLPTTTLRDVPKPLAEKEAPFIKANIYFVDDEPALTALFKESLSDAGYIVKTFEDGLSAFQSYSENNDECDLLIADISMPELNGIQLAQKVRQINPDLPIILYSGYSDVTIQKKCREMGIRFYVKPILPDTLAHYIREMLSEK